MTNTPKRRKMTVGAAIALTGLTATAMVGFRMALAVKAKPTVVIGYENNGADPEMVAIFRDLFPKFMHAKIKLRLFSSGPVALAALVRGRSTL